MTALLLLKLKKLTNLNNKTYEENDYKINSHGGLPTTYPILWAG